MIRILHILEHLAGGGGCVSPLHLAAEADRPGVQEHEFLSLGAVNEALIATVPTLPIHRKGQRSQAELAVWVADQKYDILHWHWWERMPFLDLMASCPNQRSVITCDVYPSRREYRLNRRELGSAHLLVFDGLDAYNAYPEVPDERKTWIVGSARLDLFARTTRDNTRDKLIFGRGSSLNRFKCPPDLIASVAPILQAVPRSEFHIFGDGPLRRSLARDIQERGLSNRILLRGWVYDFEQQMADLDIYLYHLPMDSYASSELNLQGAAAAGLPIVFVPSRGTRWMFQHGIEALIADNSSQAASYAIDLAADAEARSALGRAAKAKALQQWGVQQMAAEYRTAVYDRVAASALSPSRKTVLPARNAVRQSPRRTAMRLARFARRARRWSRDRWL